MDQFAFLCDAFLRGFLTLISEEFVQNTQVVVPTILISYVAGLLIYVLFSLKFNQTIAWSVAGFVTAYAASVVRMGIVELKYVAFHANIDCFASQGLTDTTYLLIGLSGCAAGLLMSTFFRTWIKAISLPGIAIGVLYHLTIASDWITTAFPSRQLLGLGEFLAPMFFVILFYGSIRFVFKYFQGVVKD